jgi:hypothetical protein
MFAGWCKLKRFAEDMDYVIQPQALAELQTPQKTQSDR